MSYPESLEVDRVVRECHEVHVRRESVRFCNVVDESVGTNVVFDESLDIVWETIGAPAKL